MHIGIVAPCNVNEFSEYLDNASKEKLVFRKSSAPAINTLILELLRTKNRVTVFTTHPVPEMLFLRGNRLHVYIVPEYDRYPGKYLYGCWINAWRLKKCIQQYRSDIELLHANWTYEYAWAAGQFVDMIPVICTVRDWIPNIWLMASAKNKITWSFKYLINFAVFRIKGINFIANSPYIAELIKKKWGKFIPIIPNPIKHAFIRKERAYYPDCFKIVTIAQSNDKIKNIETLLYAFQQFHKKNSVSSLSLIGAPFFSGDKIVKKWGKRGLLEDVNLLGAVKHNDLIDILDNSSLLVHPSLEESFGNTLIEAMARRVPVIGGVYSGAVPYVLDYGKAGCLCNISSANEIASKIELIYKDKAYREYLVTNATELILNKYLDSVILIQHQNLYNEIIKMGLCLKN
jgi:glycosyltransferase involved in cell wall biosynthesis